MLQSVPSLLAKPATKFFFELVRVYICLLLSFYTIQASCKAVNVLSNRYFSFHCYCISTCVLLIMYNNMYIHCSVEIQRLYIVRFSINFKLTLAI